MTVIRASDVAGISRGLAEATANGTRISGFDLSEMNRVVRHAVEDMTVTVEAGMTIADMRRALRGAGQWLPVDPPDAEELSIGAMLATDASGPRRFGYGSAREYLIGIKVVLADGTVVRSGGNVVKNVAGYDLAKIFVGSRGAFGIIAEATFRLRPLPQVEAFADSGPLSPSQARELLEDIFRSRLQPVVIDLHNQSGDQGTNGSSNRWRLVVGFDGFGADVDREIERARGLGLDRPGNLEHENRFRERAAAARASSVPPSAIVDEIERHGAVSFVARAGNGLLRYTGGEEPRRRTPPRSLFERLKDTYDPRRILPEFDFNFNS